MQWVFPVYAMCIRRYSICVLCAFHVNAMCAHGHVHAMGSHVYSMWVQCVSNVYCMFMTCVFHLHGVQVCSMGIPSNVFKLLYNYYAGPRDPGWLVMPSPMSHGDVQCYAKCHAP